jgi:hypothetical protein
LKLGTQVLSGYYPRVDQSQNEFLIEIEELVEQIFLDVDGCGSGQATDRLDANRSTGFFVTFTA